MRLAPPRAGSGYRPERKREITALGLMSLLAGTLATPMTGAVVSVF